MSGNSIFILGAPQDFTRDNDRKMKVETKSSALAVQIRHYLMAQAAHGVQEVVDLLAKHHSRDRF